MSRRHIAEAWERFERLVVPANAQYIQRMCTRQAFYAGAMSMFDALMRNVSDSEEHTPEDDQLGEDIQAEIAAFGKEVEAAVRRGHW